MVYFSFYSSSFRAISTDRRQIGFSCNLESCTEQDDDTKVREKTLLFSLGLTKLETEKTLVVYNDHESTYDINR